MEEKVLSGLGGVGIYGVISICIFFAFFTGMLIWVVFLRQPYLKSMQELPLEDEPASQTQSRTSPGNHEL
jgi:hypothetical protein